jgi:hypothetical protein
MRKPVVIAGLALGVALTAFVGNAGAYTNYPWCIIGDTRGIDCVFATREQCAFDGRNRGFGGQCIRNPGYDPRKPAVVQEPIPGQPPARQRSH